MLQKEQKKKRSENYTIDMYKESKRNIEEIVFTAQMSDWHANPFVYKKGPGVGFCFKNDVCGQNVTEWIFLFHYI